jgi:hypothetical protein
LLFFRSLFTYGKRLFAPTLFFERRPRSSWVWGLVDQPALDRLLVPRQTTAGTVWLHCISGKTTDPPVSFLTIESKEEKGNVAG